MSGSAKRPFIVDLTGDEVDEQPQPKIPRVPLSTATHLANSRPNPRPNPLYFEDEDEGGANEIIVNSSQSDENNTVAFTLVGELDGKIVGVRYYNGYASVGETVLLRREPNNQYDRNAVRVDNVQGTQIGHLPKEMAAKLAPYMDQGSLKVEATLSGEKRFYDCPVKLHFFATSDPSIRLELTIRMKADGLIKEKKEKKKLAEKVDHNRKKMGFKGAPPTFSGDQQPVDHSSEEALETIMQNSERFNPRDLQELVEQWGAPEEALANMPFAKQPEALQSKLLPYQLQGLKWMLTMEQPELPGLRSPEVVQLWKRSEVLPGSFQNIATRFTTSQPPSLASGGILADDMGLGKTLQVISLILEGGPGTTLVIAPVSVMSNWSQQIQRHVKTTSPLRVITYHGSGRKAMAEKEFSDYDVVISSYGTMSSEYSPSRASKSGLFAMNWRRVVLDEGHTIRNSSTKAAVAASSLSARSRWILSGTPIVNTVRDLHSMLKFLRITGGLEKLEVFNSVLARPLTNGDKQGEVLLQTIMRTMCLRRKKEMKFVDLRLPELTEYVHRIQFRKDEREKYKAFQAEAQGLLHKYENRHEQAQGQQGDAYRHLLEILLRLRQVCCHWKLCGDRVSSLLKLIETETVVELNPENRLALQALLALSVENSDECPICLETVHNPVITACKHVFGFECIERTIREQHKCPLCRAPMGDTDQLVYPAVEGQQDDELDVEEKSSKTEALMNILKASRQDPKSKVVIFSQWTSFLNVIQKQLDDAGYKYTRIDGKMPARQRDAAMAALEQDPDVRIMLASLAVCSVGLNLVAADTVILADTWWSAAIEDQAVDRVHRLGQKRPTTVWRLIMDDSIEERVLEVQKEKRQLVGKAFQEQSKREGGKTTRLADIQKLLK